MNVVLVSTISEVEVPEVLGGGVIEAEELVVPGCVELDDWLDDDDRLGERVGVDVGVVVEGVGGVEDGAGGAVVDDGDEVELEPVPLSWRFWIATPLRKASLAAFMSTMVASATDNTESPRTSRSRSLGERIVTGG